MLQCCREEVCRSCVEPYLNGKPCPRCKEGDLDITPLKKDREKINNLMVFCREKESGCGWTGKLQDLEVHLRKEEDGCQFSPMECPKCQELVNRCDMTDHQKEKCSQREYRCRHCNFVDTYDFVTRAHHPQCSYYPVACPHQECSVTGERGDMEIHRENCPEQYIDCDYKNAGCDVKYRRKNKEDHMKLYRENHRAMFEVHYLKEKATAAAQIEQLQRKNQEIEEKMSKVITESRQRKEEVDNLKDKVAMLERQLLEIGQRFTLEINDIKQGVDKANRLPGASAAAAHVPMPPIQELPYQEPWEFTVDDFTAKKANQEKWEGPLMTTPLGYNLQVDVWPNGQHDGKDSHVSVWLQYRKESGGKQQWPAKITMTLELLNQYPGAEKWQNPIMESFNVLCDRYTRQVNCIGAFSNTLIAHKTLGVNQQTKRQFLKDDKLKMRITLLEEKPIDTSAQDLI